MAPVLVSYRCEAGTTGATGCGALDWAAARAVATGAMAVGSMAGGEDLMRGLKDELWPPRVLAIGEMSEDLGRWGRLCCRGGGGGC